MFCGIGGQCSKLKTGNNKVVKSRVIENKACVVKTFNFEDLGKPVE